MRWLLMGLVGFLGACAAAPPPLAVPWTRWGDVLAARCAWSQEGIIIRADDAEVLIQPLVQCSTPPHTPVLRQEVK